MDQKGLGMTQEPIIYARNLVKRYGRVVALDHCDFELMPGEILAVIGDNGAGKSTVVKVLTGIYQPDEGDIQIGGQLVSLPDPQTAESAGVTAIHQETVLFVLRSPPICHGLA